MLLILLICTLVTVCNGCPPWTYNNGSGQCQCGDSLKGLVHCNRETRKVSVLFCYCMTYNKQINETLVGQCLIMCNFIPGNDCKSHNEIQAKTLMSLDNEICGILMRTGQLCGECIEGHGAPVYSYSLKCVKCKESDFRYNLFKYIAVAFLPLTVFYLVVIIFKISVTSGFMVASVLISQVLSSPSLLRLITDPHSQSTGSNIVIAILAIWNLDFFRSLYTPFCIHPEMSTLQVLALDYVVGIYPLVLIFLTYIAVTLHDRYPLIVKIWKPAYKCFICIRREWNIRGSLVQAFCTFLVLSYVKILNVSFDLLTPVFLQDIRGNRLKQPYLFNDGEILYFGKEHRPYGIIAIIMLTVFNVLPLTLLLLYPCRCIHKCLSYFRLHSHALHIFIDVFQGYYRHQPRDCRYFSAIPLLIRVLNLFTFAFFRDNIFFPLTGLDFLLLAIAVVLIQPYQENLHNQIDAGFCLFMACGYILCALFTYVQVFQTQMNPYIFLFPVFVILFIHVFYTNTMLILNFVPRKIVTKFKHCLNCKNTAVDIENSFLHQFEHVNDYSPLLQ